MAKLENYDGSIDLISGLRQKNNQDFPLIEAHAIQVSEDDTRLDEELYDIKNVNLQHDTNISSIQQINIPITANDIPKIDNKDDIEDEQLVFINSEEARSGIDIITIDNYSYQTITVSELGDNELGYVRYTGSSNYEYYSIDKNKNLTLLENGIDDIPTTSSNFDSTATGVGSVSFGNQNIASGNFSHSEGFHNKAIGGESHAEGLRTIAKGSQGHTEGCDTVVWCRQGHAEGYNTEAGKPEDFEADSSAVNGIKSGTHGAHAEGSGSKATAKGSHAEGVETLSTGEGAHAEGKWSRSFGAQSHSEGGGGTSLGNQSHTEGYYNIADAMAAHAEGRENSAIGYYSHVAGSYNFAFTPNSSVEGTYAIPDIEHLGISHENIKDCIWGGAYDPNKTYNPNTIVYYIDSDKTNHLYKIKTKITGKSHPDINNILDNTIYENIYSIKDSDKKVKGKYIKIIGNGSSAKNRSNAHTLDWNGNAWFCGQVKIGGNGQDDSEAKILATEDQVNNVKSDIDDKLNILIDTDNGKSIRTIANEELIKQLVTEDAQESLDTLKEIAAWIQNHPKDAADMNESIKDLQDNKANSDHTHIIGYSDLDDDLKIKIDNSEQINSLKQDIARLDNMLQNILTVLRDNGLMPNTVSHIEQTTTSYLEERTVSEVEN